MGTTNIATNPVKAISTIIEIDNRQLMGGPHPILFNWEIYHWTQIESTTWTGYRTTLEPLLQPYIDKKNITPAQRTLIKDTIKQARDLCRS